MGKAGGWTVCDKFKGVRSTLGEDRSLSLGGSAGFFCRWAIGLSSDKLRTQECFPKMIDRLERTSAAWSQLERVTKMPLFAFDRLARSHYPRELRPTADPQALDITSRAVVHGSVPFGKVKRRMRIESRR